jgi:electron transport complex protein RnfA
MDTLKSLIVILMTSVLVNNYVLQKFLGICPFLGVSKKLDQATGMSIAVIFSVLLWRRGDVAIQTYLLTPRHSTSCRRGVHSGHRRSRSLC